METRVGTSAWLMVTLLTVVGGCSDARERSARDDAAAATSSGEITISPHPRVTIALSDHEASEIHRVVGATPTPDGGVVLLTDGEPFLQHFDALGRLRGTAARERGGPGERDLPRQVERCGGDSLFVWDQRLQRVAVYDGDLEYQRGFRLPGGAVIFECRRDGRLVALTSPRPGPSGGGGTATRLVASLVWSNTNGDSLGGGEELPLVVMQPLGATTSLGVASSHVVVGTGAGPEIQLLEGAGIPLARVKVNSGPERAPTAAEVHAAIEEVIAVFPSEEDRAFSRKELSQMEPAARLPSYRKLLVDDEDRVFLITSALGGAITEVRVVGVDGSPSGELILPFDGDVLAVDGGRLAAVTASTAAEPLLRVYDLD